MISKTKKTLLAAIFIGTVGLFAWPGCITPPLPAKRTPVGSRTKETFIVPKSEPLTREEVIQRFGKPDNIYPDIGVISYTINNVTKRDIWLCLFVIPINVDQRPGYFDLTFMSFDPDGKLQYSGYEPDSYPSKQSAINWLAAQKKKHPQSSH